MGMKKRNRKTVDMYVWRGIDIAHGDYEISQFDPELFEVTTDETHWRRCTNGMAAYIMRACPLAFEAATGINLTYEDGVKRVRMTFEMLVGTNSEHERDA